MNLIFLSRLRRRIQEASKLKDNKLLALLKVRCRNVEINMHHCLLVYSLWCVWCIMQRLKYDSRIIEGWHVKATGTFLQTGECFRWGLIATTHNDTTCPVSTSACPPEVKAGKAACLADYVTLTVHCMKTYWVTYCFLCFSSRWHHLFQIRSFGRIFDLEAERDILISRRQVEVLY